MKTYINERSLPNNLSTADQAFEILEQVVLMAPFAITISNNQVIGRHRELANQIILPGITLIDFVRSLLKDKNRKRADVGSAFLRLFVKGPFIEFVHEEKDSIKDCAGLCMKGSCFDEAASQKAGASLLSFKDTSSPQSTSYTINSSRFGARKIRNFYEVTQIKESCWIYESNPKHALKEDKVIDGVVHSAMRLPDALAQRILTNGVMCGASVFNRHDGVIYKFHNHEGNKFHGFPISIKTPYKDFTTASKILNLIGDNVDGQVFSEDF